PSLSSSSNSSSSPAYIPSFTLNSLDSSVDTSLAFQSTNRTNSTNIDPSITASESPPLTYASFSGLLNFNDSFRADGLFFVLPPTIVSLPLLFWTIAVGGRFLVILIQNGLS